VLGSTETHSMAASISCRGPKIALASSRPRSGSNPEYRPLGSRLDNGAVLSSTPIRILPFVWSAYMYVASSKRGRADVAAAVGVAVGTGDASGKHAVRATAIVTSAASRGAFTSGA
jgi:hypothetical protein